MQARSSSTTGPAPLPSSWDAYRLEATRRSLPRLGLRRGRSRSRARAVGCALSDHGEPHRHASLQQALRDGARRARSASGLRGETGQAPLRLHSTTARSPPSSEGRSSAAVNELVFENRPVHVFETPIDEARRLGATMLFGEKYGGHRACHRGPWNTRSICAVDASSNRARRSGRFVFLSESSVGSARAASRP
jgi:hypothetical protein